MSWLRAAMVAVLSIISVSAQSTIFVVRHADRYGAEPDPSLTPEGLRQAASLARLLADSKITRIFTSEALRTHQTAAPTAERFHLAPVVLDAQDLDSLTRAVRAGLHDGDATLIVGHRATVPRIVKALTGKDVPPLAVDEYDRLEVITLFGDGRSSVVTLRFGH